MKYFVVSDVHGFFDILVDTLVEKGFDINNPNHKLIICGDYFDRGEQVQKMQAFLVGLIKRDKVILIRGNHEDLMIDYLNNFECYSRDLVYTHHYANGTVDTAFNLAQKDWTKNNEFMAYPDEFVRDVKNSPFMKHIFPKTLNYFETEHFIFTHGYIPCNVKEKEIDSETSIEEFSYNKEWRNADSKSWEEARWLNGQYIAKRFNVIEPNKTIVCGHIICSFGHSFYENNGSEYGEDADFSPYYSKGLIAIDAQTAYSKKMNCLVIKD